MRRLLASGAAACALALSACGSETAEPAALAPERSFAYAEATLAPEGDQKEAVDAIANKFPGEGSAGDRLRRLIDRGLRESDEKLSYKEDVEPWLGDELAFFASPPRGGGNPPAAALVATDDEDAALEAARKGERSVREQEHNGVEVLRFDEDSAAATVDGWLVLGNPAGVEAAIDASKDDKALESTDQFKRALDRAPDDRLGVAYVDFRALIGAIPAGGGAAAGPFRNLFREPFVVTADADRDGIELESVISADAARRLGTGAGGDSAVLSDLPGDAFAALGGSDLGQQALRQVDLFAAQVGGRGLVDQQVRAATGLELQDLIGWMGDFAVFARGTDQQSLGGALVVQTTDPRASARALDALARLARRQGQGQILTGRLTLPGGGQGFTLRAQGLPQPVHAVQRGDRVVIAYGDQAASAAFGSAQKLDDAPAFERASGSLGEGYSPSFFVSVDSVLRLAEALGASSSSEYGRAKPYLDPLEALVAGSKQEGGEVRTKLRLSLP